MLKRENVVGYKKIGYYHSEKQLFREIDLKTGMNGCRHPLSYLLEAADDIAYRTSDLEDAMVKKVISFHQICRVFEQYMEKMEKDQSRKRGYVPYFFITPAVSGRNHQKQEKARIDQCAKMESMYEGNHDQRSRRCLCRALYGDHGRKLQRRFI